MQKVIKIVVPTAGPAMAIYSPEAEKLLSGLGDVTIARASHIVHGSSITPYMKVRLLADNRWTDECRKKWFANLEPVKGPVLGPFDTRVAAIEEEIKYINENLTRIANDHANSRRPNS
jgi:hypothetical protein